ncbi:MAG: ArnT family glycosyltransferase [Planctomycetota bacterium]|jgi:hypothetical protein
MTTEPLVNNLVQNAETSGTLRSGLVAFAIVLIIILLQIFVLGGRMNVAQGDHGKDILIAAEILEGRLPLRHYPFAYGPLGPYVLAGAFAVFGVSAFVARAVWCVFYLSSVIVFFLALRKRVGDFASACVAVALSLFTWFNLYTFYHEIAVLFFVLALLVWVRDLPKAPQSTGRLIALGIFLGLFTVAKPNMGIAMIVAVLATGIVGIFQESGRSLITEIKRYGIAAGIAMVVILVIYIPHLIGDGPGLSGAAGGLRIQPEGPIVQMFERFYYILANPGAKTMKNLIMSNPTQLAFTLALGITFIVFFVIRNRWRTPEFALLSCGMLITVFGSHEFFIIGTHWSLHTWALPGMAIVWAAALTIILPSLVNFPLKPGNAGITVAAFLCIFLLGLFAGRIGRKKTTVYCDHPRMNVSVEDAGWWKVVSAGTEFITENTKPDEKMLCAIDDALYYVLSDRKPVSRYLRMDEIARIDDAKQNEIIEGLKKNNCRLILISNRSFNSTVPGVGVLGKTHGKILWKYIAENYSAVKTIGPWDKLSGQIGNHAIRFYLRNDLPFPPKE